MSDTSECPLFDLFSSSPTPVGKDAFFGMMVAEYFVSNGTVTPTLRKMFSDMNSAQQDCVLEAMNAVLTRETLNHG